MTCPALLALSDACVDATKTARELREASRATGRRRLHAFWRNRAVADPDAIRGTGRSRSGTSSSYRCVRPWTCAASAAGVADLVGVSESQCRLSLRARTYCASDKMPRSAMLTASLIGMEKNVTPSHRRARRPRLVRSAGRNRLHANTKSLMNASSSPESLHPPKSASSGSASAGRSGHPWCSCCVLRLCEWPGMNSASASSPTTFTPAKTPSSWCATTRCRATAFWESKRADVRTRPSAMTPA